MAGEKYIVAADNPLQISIRNMLNPYGYLCLGNCYDALSLMKLARNYHPDFIVADLGLQSRELRHTLETLDDEMLCACIVVGAHKDMEMISLLENSRILSLCPKPLSKELLLHTVDMSLINYKRIYSLNRKLKEMTENYETRKVVDKAKWILMERDKISENEAYEKMRKKSMDSRMSMKAIADAVIFTHEIGNK